MRKLQTKDVCTALRIIKTAGIKDEVKSVTFAVQNNPKLNVKDVGFDFILGCLEKASEINAERSIYEFVADLLEMDVESVETYDLMEFMKLLVQLYEFNDPKAWRSFFKSVARQIAK